MKTLPLFLLSTAVLTATVSCASPRQTPPPISWIWAGTYAYRETLSQKNQTYPCIVHILHLTGTRGVWKGTLEVEDAFSSKYILFRSNYVVVTRTYGNRLDVLFERQANGSKPPYLKRGDRLFSLVRLSSTQLETQWHLDSPLSPNAPQDGHYFRRVNQREYEDLLPSDEKIRLREAL
ncbi:hypothetical protein IAD21_00817 [Abditibacteriota bacterium]|nr:hypothetical protein IAD21_00817 [Abditibacteriota bacterium]